MDCFNINGKTRVCGVIGDPIEHTMSPVMHNTAFRQLGLDYIYVPFRVKKEALGKTIDGMRALGIRGLNVTIPHKVSVIPLLDKIDPDAEKIGAVNTIINEAGTLTGYNTDAAGFLQALREGGFEPKDKKVIILGAGGAARAISFVLARNETRLTILNRQLELDWAVTLAQQLSRISKGEVKALLMDEPNLTAALRDADLVVNATSVGMSPEDKETPVPAPLLRPGLTVFDAVYHPLQTRLLREAKKAGAKTISGIEMLVWQGALAFTMWTGQQAPTDLMREEAIKALEYEK
ncbi:shikimate dehydrogenase [Chloroflexota bacterium]